MNIESRLTALIGGDLSKVDAQQPGDYFTTISSDDHEGKWRVVFFWPKDFTFVCPTEIAAFGKEAYAMGIHYLGVCCGAGPHHIRALAEAVGKHPPASKYSAGILLPAKCW